MTVGSCEFESHLLHNKLKIQRNAEIAQLVEHNLAKVGVASSSLVFRSKVKIAYAIFFFASVVRARSFGRLVAFFSPCPNLQL